MVGISCAPLKVVQSQHQTAPPKKQLSPNMQRASNAIVGDRSCEGWSEWMKFAQLVSQAAQITNVETNPAYVRENKMR